VLQEFNITGTALLPFLGVLVVTEQLGTPNLTRCISR
jgi:hypothetical protein